MLEYFFQIGVSVATEVEVNHQYSPWIGYPAPELGPGHEGQPELLEHDRRRTGDSSSVGDSSLAEAGSHMATLQDLVVVPLLIKASHSLFKKRVYLCLDPFPSIFWETLGILLRYGASLSITISLCDLSWLEGDGTGRPRSDPEGAIKPLPSDLEGTNHDDNDDDGDSNMYFLTSRLKYQLLRRIHLTRDEDRSEIITFCGVIGSFPGLLRSFWELLISSGGSITLRDFLCFIKPPNLDVPLPPVGDDRSDGGSVTAYSSASSGGESRTSNYIR